MKQQSGRPGPVWFDIPADIQSSYVDEKELYKYKFSPLKTKNKIDDKLNILQKNCKFKKAVNSFGSWC